MEAHWPSQPGKHRVVEIGTIGQVIKTIKLKSISLKFAHIYFRLQALGFRHRALGPRLQARSLTPKA